MPNTSGVPGRTVYRRVRLWVGLLLGWTLGVESQWLVWGGWWTVVAVAVWVMATTSVVLWMRVMLRMDAASVATWDWTDRTFGEALRDGAVIVIRRGSHPEVPVEVLTLVTEEDDP